MQVVVEVVVDVMLDDVVVNRVAVADEKGVRLDEQQHPLAEHELPHPGRPDGVVQLDFPPHFGQIEVHDRPHEDENTREDAENHVDVHKGPRLEARVPFIFQVILKKLRGKINYC